MDYVNSESIYLKEAEWKFFLSGLGFTEIYGVFSMEKEETDNREQIHQMLVDLYLRKVIACEENRIYVLPPISEFLKLMQKNKKCVLLRKCGSEHPIKCCYLAENTVLVMEKSQREKASIRLCQMTFEAWLGYVLEEIEENEEMQFFVQDSRKDILYEKIIYKEDGIRELLIIETDAGQIQKEYQPDFLIEKIKNWM
ncbi:MAG: hypothetical protein J6A92_07950 [Lachnospiraceae bacterium]|nr:hypothetical protein [Lachnospiraceae bacterium]